MEEFEKIIGEMMEEMLSTKKAYEQGLVTEKQYMYMMVGVIHRNLQVLLANIAG